MSRARPAIPLCPQCDRTLHLNRRGTHWHCPDSACGHREEAPVYISAHAILRYLQRVKQVTVPLVPEEAPEGEVGSYEVRQLRALRQAGINVSRLCEEILPPRLAYDAARWNQEIGPLTLVLPTHRLPVRDCTVTTCLPPRQFYTPVDERLERGCALV